MTTSPLRVLGIDPGTRRCGWGLVARRGSQITHIDNGVFVLGDKRPLHVRLGALLDGLEDVIARYKPDVMAVEGIFQHRNARSALVLGHARGVALAAAARAGIEVHDYTPQQVKKAVAGTGRADKIQVQQMVTLRLGLLEPPQEDAADAVAVALCHAQHLIMGPGPVVQVPKAPRGGKKRADAALAALVQRQMSQKQTSQK